MHGTGETRAPPFKPVQNFAKGKPRFRKEEGQPVPRSHMHATPISDAGCAHSPRVICRR
ncbi:protein of unknown function (plasmid) [Caballeronia sp. S22]